MTTYNYAFFQTVEKEIQKKPALDVCDRLRSYARAKTCASYTCYALSCLGCCCCTRCAGECLNIGDGGAMWRRTLTAVYRNRSKEEMRVLFLHAMTTLRGIERRLQDALDHSLEAMAQVATEGNVSLYQLASVKTLSWRQQLTSGSWAPRLMTNVRQTMVQYNSLNVDAQTTTAAIDGVSLTNDEFRALVASIGLLFPMCFNHNFVFNLNTTELDIIRWAVAASF